jgi:hypothetical protein
MLKVLEEDFARLPGLLERTEAATPVAPPAVAPAALRPVASEPEPVQLGLF